MSNTGRAKADLYFSPHLHCIHENEFLISIAEQKKPLSTDEKQARQQHKRLKKEKIKLKLQYKIHQLKREK